MHVIPQCVIAQNRYEILKFLWWDESGDAGWHCDLYFGVAAFRDAMTADLVGRDEARAAD
jgi:hypothetical protein